MNSTFSATVTTSLEVFQSIKKDEAPRPVTITLTINPIITYPHAMRVALLYLAGQNAMFSDYDTFSEFKRQMETLRPIEQMVSDWATQFDKDADPWKIIKYVTASPKPVVDEPPVSCCPRCNKPVWGSPADLDKSKLLDLYTKNPIPLYCLKCGQRFKYDDSSRLTYSAAANSNYWQKRLAREAQAQQPTLAAL